MRKIFQPKTSNPTPSGDSFQETASRSTPPEMSIQQKANSLEQLVEAVEAANLIQSQPTPFIEGNKPSTTDSTPMIKSVEAATTTSTTPLIQGVRLATRKVAEIRASLENIIQAVNKWSVLKQPPDPTQETTR